MSNQRRTPACARISRRADGERAVIRLLGIPRLTTSTATHDSDQSAGLETCRDVLHSERKTERRGDRRGEYWRGRPWTSSASCTALRRVPHLDDRMLPLDLSPPVFVLQRGGEVAEGERDGLCAHACMQSGGRGRGRGAGRAGSGSGRLRAQQRLRRSAHGGVALYGLLTRCADTHTHGGRGQSASLSRHWSARRPRRIVSMAGVCRCAAAHRCACVRDHCALVCFSPHPLYSLRPD